MAVEEATDDHSGDRESYEQWQWQRRKLRTMTSGAKKALDVSTGDGESCGPIPRRWKELHTEATMAEGIAHESYSSESFGPIRQRQRKRRTCASTTVAHKGNSRTRAAKYLVFMGSRLHKGEGENGCGLLLLFTMLRWFD